MPRAELSEMFHAGQSPYFAMFRAGLLGYTIEEVGSYCSMLGIPLRQKDIQSWKDGNFKGEMQRIYIDKARKTPGYFIEPFHKVSVPGLAHHANGCTSIRTRPEQIKFEDLTPLPDKWCGTERRFFPCNQENRPMQPWGYKENFLPNLMTKPDAKACSPCGYVGQNMMYQPFIVMDIDGVGHGCIDEPVIQFGNLFKDRTLSFEDPKKKGSFHLYFKTDRLIPVKHFPHAKLDLMGNAVNAAVYFKNKIGNGLPMLELTPSIWNAMMEYQKQRLAERK